MTNPSGEPRVKGPGFLRKYIFSTDHKVIGRQFLFAGIFFLLFGGLLALAIRWQQAYPFATLPLFGKVFFPATEGRIMPETYTMLFTMHGTIMVFFAITPILIGAFGNFVIPLQIGARDMSFPKINMLSFWLFALACLVILVSFFVPQGAASAGWTAYAPLSSNSVMTVGLGQTLWMLGLVLFGISTLMGAINYITTTLAARAPGLSFMRLPLTVWGLCFSAVLNVIWVPVIATALIMLLLDRVLGTTFFLAGSLATGPAGAGQPLLYQHLFWGFGHPEVYILIFPVWGIVGDLLSVFARKPAFGYKATVYAMMAITILSGLVWGHHMFTTPMSPLLGKTFTLLTITVSVPTAIFFLNWLATLWRGSIRFTVPMLFSLGVVFVFALGGLTGLFNALQTLDIYVHDTYIVVAHFHFTLSAAVLLGAFAGIYYWFPKFFGRQMNPFWGKVHFWATFITLNLAFFPMFFLGVGGMLRRLADPSTYHFLQHLQPINLFVSHSAFALGAVQIIFLGNFIWSLFRGKKAPANPWEAATLEWAVASPPPHHNFEEIPTVLCGPHEYALATPDNRDYLPQAQGQGVS